MENFDNNQFEDISFVNIYDLHNNLIYREKLNNPSYIHVTAKAPIEYNEQIYGYLQIKPKITKMITKDIRLNYVLVVLLTQRRWDSSSLYIDLM